MKSSPCSALVWLRAHHTWSSVRCSETKMSHQRRLSSWKKPESQVSEPCLFSTPADTFLLNVCRHHSLSVWSCSYTSWLVFCDRPGKMGPSSDRSLSPGRTSGPALRRSWNTAEIQKGRVRDSCKKHNISEIIIWNQRGQQFFIEQVVLHNKICHCEHWATDTRVSSPVLQIKRSQTQLGENRCCFNFSSV